MEIGLRVLNKQGVDTIYFLGDSVGYYPSTSAVQKLLENQKWISCIRGNHETMLLSREFDNNRTRTYRLDETAALLSAEEMNFIKSWPVSRELTLDRDSMLFVHGTPRDPLNGYSYPDGEIEVPDGNYQVVFQGNTHWPMVRMVGRVLFVNPGSCSLPRDIGSLGSVATYDTETKNVRILRYSISEVSEELLREFPDTLEQVAAVFSRKNDNYLGELVQ
jgi:predicted phosphodiesterase